MLAWRDGALRPRPDGHRDLCPDAAGHGDGERVDRRRSRAGRSGRRWHLGSPAACSSPAPTSRSTRPATTGPGTPTSSRTPAAPVPRTPGPTPRAWTRSSGPGTTVEAAGPRRVGRRVGRPAARPRPDPGHRSSPPCEPDVATWSTSTTAASSATRRRPSCCARPRTVVDALTLPVLVVEAQLLVLCWLVLFLVVANAAEARGPEVALAKLRGVGIGADRRVRAARHRAAGGAGRPASGSCSAWAWTVGLARWQLAPGVPVVLTARRRLGGGRRRGRRGGRRPCWPPPARCVVPWSSSGVAPPGGSAPVPGWWTRRSPSSPSSGLVALLVGPGAAGAAAGCARAGRPEPGHPAGRPGRLAGAAGLCRAAYGPTRRRGWVAGLLAVRQLGPASEHAAARAPADRGLRAGGLRRGRLVGRARQRARPGLDRGRRGRRSSP